MTFGYHVIKNATSSTSTTTTNYTDTSPCGGSYLSDSSGNAIIRCARQFTSIELLVLTLLLTIWIVVQLQF